jgi:DNA-binding MarR family transcriptional regulator
MSVNVKPSQALKLLHEISLAMVREPKATAAPDFTLRQLAVLLTIYLDHPPHTVRGLARKLGVTKPVITRALDAMGKQAVVTRRRDEGDRRNVIVQRTVKGALYVETLADMVIAKAQELP